MDKKDNELNNDNESNIAPVNESNENAIFNSIDSPIPPEPPKKKNRTKLIAIIIGCILILSAAGIGGYKYFHKPNIQNADSSFNSLGKSNSDNSQSSTKDPNWVSIASNVKKSTVSIMASQESYFGESTSAGSGMIFDSAKGYILTNNHVVSGSKDLKVSLYNGQEYSASIVGTDPEDDLAVIKLSVSVSGLKAVEFGDSEKVVVGQPVMAVGNPLGLDQTVTVGIISAVNRPVTTQSESTNEYQNATDVVVTNALQTDTAINPGNSGGPLFDGSGKVIGVNSSIASLSQDSSSSQSGSIGIGFSIPSNLASTVAQSLAKTGKVKHSLLGVTLKDTTVKVGNSSRTGAQIQKVTSNSAASAAGLKDGDVIIGINSYPTNGATSLTAFIRSYAPGTKVEITFVRDGSTKKTTATLKSK